MKAKNTNCSTMDAPGRGETCRTTERSFRKRIEEKGKAGDFDSVAVVVVDKYSVVDDDIEGGGGGGGDDDIDAVRKRAGCRRTLKDMLSAEAQDHQKADKKNQDAMVLLDDCILEKTPPLRRKKYRSFRRVETRRRLVFTSPRVMSSDEDLFPTDHSPYMQWNQRWQKISNQAGCHRQEGIVMNIGRKPASAKAFRIGMIESAAVRVRSLNLWLNHQQDTLPDWLDMIGEVFVNLEHLTLTEDIFPGEIEMAVSARMRRLYVLSILPNLKSIDDMVVTSKERKMANPNGFTEKPQVKTSETTRSENNKSIDPDGEHQDPSPTNKSIEEGGADPKPLSPSNKNKNKNKNNKPIEIEIEIENDEDDQRDDSEGTTDVPVPVSINTDSVGSAKANANANAIEVEIVDREFQEMKLMGTQTTTSTSPTSNAESTITAIDSNNDDDDDDDELDENNDEYGGGLNKIVKTDSRERGLNSPSDEEISVGGAGKQRYNNNNNNNKAVDSAIKAEEDDIPATVDGTGNGIQSLADSLGGDETNCTATTLRNIRKLDSDLSDTIELVSVTSHDLEWTAACGILTFRTDRACAPKIRLPFSSRDKKKSDATTEACQKAVENLRKKDREKEKGSTTSRLNACTPVNRKSAAIVCDPQVGCCPILKNVANSQTKFLFPAEAKGGPLLPNNGVAPNEKSFEVLHLSANKQLPPSKSLSSPFPMQFRERQKLASNFLAAQLVVNTSDSMEVRTGSSCDSKDSNEMETIASPLSIVTSPASSPTDSNNKPKKANKGELPPKCPSRRQVPACKILKKRKEKTDRRRKLNEVSKESARSISVMDLDDDDEFCDENLENNEEIESVDRSNQVVTVM